MSLTLAGIKYDELVFWRKLLLCILFPLLVVLTIIIFFIIIVVASPLVWLYMLVVLFVGNGK